MLHLSTPGVLAFESQNVTFDIVWSKDKVTKTYLTFSVIWVYEISVSCARHKTI